MQPKTTSKAKRPVGKPKKEITFPLGKENFMIIGLGIVVLIVGYFIMSQNSVDGFMPTVVAPIVLLAGYCLIIPYGILKKPKSAGDISNTAESTPDTNLNTPAQVSSNIKTS
jgi:hypothetical protein